MFKDSNNDVYIQFINEQYSTEYNSLVVYHIFVASPNCPHIGHDVSS